MKKLVLIFLMDLILAIGNVSHAKSNSLQKDIERNENYGGALTFRKDVKNGKLRARTNKTVDAMVKVSVAELKRKGAVKLSEKITQEYETTYHDFMGGDEEDFILPFRSGFRPVGDHAGVEWLLKIHANIEFVLGETICRAIRLHDIWTLAMTIPVVFSCEDNVDQMEYFLHFDPFAGIVSYWVSYAICSGASMASGMVFACGFIGMAVEQIVTRFIAPPLSPSCWKKACSALNLEMDPLPNELKSLPLK